MSLTTEQIPPKEKNKIKQKQNFCIGLRRDIHPLRTYINYKLSSPLELYNNHAFNVEYNQRNGNGHVFIGFPYHKKKSRQMF